MPKVSNVYRDKRNDTWYFVANLGTDADGKRVRHWGCGYKTQREAKAGYDEYMAEYSRTAVKVNSTMSFGEFYRSYWLPHYKSRVRDSTYSDRLYLARKHYGRFDRVALRDLSKPMLQRWQNELVERYSLAYARLAYGHFAVVLDLAVKVGLLQRNPARELGNVHLKPKEVDFWSRGEFDRVISTFDVSRGVDSDYFEVFGFTCIWLFYMTGIRLGEGQALRWPDIDFSAGTMSVNYSMNYRNVRDWKLTPPKTKAGKRVIALDSLTLGHLKLWREVQSRNVCTDFVLSWSGDPMNKHTVCRIIDVRAAAAGVHRIRVHALRHSHAALLISLGENALAIRDRLGHEDVKTTLGTYGHLYQDANRAVADRLDAAFGLDGPCQPDANQPKED